MILMKLTRKRWKSTLKNENEKEEKWLKITNVFLKKKKQEENKEKEKAMWKRLGELNQEFKDIKENKKKSEKISKSILKM